MPEQLSKVVRNCFSVCLKRSKCSQKTCNSVASMHVPHIARDRSFDIDNCFGVVMYIGMQCGPRAGAISDIPDQACLRRGCFSAAS